jgi:hypothetical protein
MTWFAEDPLVIWLSAAVLFTAVLIVYLQTRQRWSLLAMAVVVLLAGGLTLLEQVLVTPREAVGQTLREVLAAVEANDLPRTLSTISPTAGEVRSDAETLMPRLEVIRADATNTPVIEFNGAAKATARFRAFVEVIDRRTGLKGAYFDDLTITFQLKGDRWKVVAYQPVKSWRKGANRFKDSSSR